MKTRNFTIILFFVVAVAATLTGCMNPFAASSRSRTGGLISVAIRPVSPVVVTSLESAGTTAMRAEAPADRAYIGASSVDFTLYDSSNQVVTTWNAQTSAFLTDQALNTTSDSFSVSAHTVPPGVGYTLKADVFSAAVSTTSPVVSGTSTAFNVDGGTTPTVVTITCLPDNPQVLAVGTADLTQSLTPWIASISGGTLTTMGEEQWFTTSLTAGTSYVYRLEPSSTTKAPLYIYDSTGNFLQSATPTMRGDTTLSFFTPSTSGTYYLGIIDTTPDSSVTAAQQVSLSLTQVQLPAQQLFLQSVVADAYQPANLQSNGGAGEMVNVYWTGPSTESYTVYRDTSSSFSSEQDVSTSAFYGITYEGSDIWEFTDYNAAFGTAYYYKVVANNASADTPAGYVTASPAPTNLTAATDTSSTGMQVSWNAVTNATGYFIQVFDANGDSPPLASYYSNTPSIVIAKDSANNFTSNTNYNFVVQADVPADGGYGYPTGSSLPVTYTGQ